MKVICYSDSEEKSKAALAAGCDLIFTAKLDDMTDPARTIYIITGADFTEDHQEAVANGYLNSKGSPLAIGTSYIRYPIAIASDLYRENYRQRLRFLREFTKAPYGLHIGGSCNMVEYCIPEGKGATTEFWCYGFKKYHAKDPELTLTQYQVDVWEIEIMDLMDQALETFKDIKEMTTGFRCPSITPTRKTTCLMTTGEEIWNALQHFKIFPQWNNIFFSFFYKEQNANLNQNKIITLKTDLERTGLGDRCYIGSEGSSALLGIDTEEQPICYEASVGTGKLAYLMGCKGGVIGAFEDFSDGVKQVIKEIQKYP